MRRRRLSSTTISSVPTAAGLLQRTCACGQHTGGGACAACRQRQGTQETTGTPVPSIVHEVLTTPGQPLDAATRATLEPHFGLDFSRVPTHANQPTRPQAKLSVGQPGDTYEQEADTIAEQVTRAPQGDASVTHEAGANFSGVRLHTDGKAGKSALALNARAYTVGNHIIFGPQRYAPGTNEGRRLIAHELTHVVQQRAGAIGIQRQAGTPAQGNADRSSADEQHEFVRQQIRFLQSGAEHFRLVTQIGEAMLRRQLEGWKRLVEGGAQIIRTSLGNDAALTHDLQAAYAAAIRVLISRAASHLGRTTHEIYQANHDNIHEWGWPLGVADATANELTAMLPAAERQQIRVVTTGITIQNLGNLFHAQAANIPLPQNVGMQFSRGVPQRLRSGLSNVAGMLTTRMNALDLNSTITLALDLEPYGGNFAAYRFTYVEHRPQQGPHRPEILVERLGSIGMEGVKPSQADAARQRFDQHGFHRDGSVSDLHIREILAGLTQIPDATLARVNGLTFRRVAAHPTIADRCGEYEVAAHAITLFDCAFPTSLTRFGQPGQGAPPAGVSNAAVFTVAHEIGHAVDLQPLRQAWAQLEQDRTALRAAFAQFERPPGSNRYFFPRAEQARWDRLQARLHAAEQARNRARAHSGARWQRNAQGVFEPGQGGVAAGDNAFRQAAVQDGGIRITRYAAQDWLEYFAESHAMYINAPETLRRLRPNVFAFFETNFARQ